MLNQQEQEQQAQEIKSLNRMIGVYQQKLADEELVNVRLTVSLQDADEQLQQVNELFKGSVREIAGIRAELAQFQTVDVEQGEASEPSPAPVAARRKPVKG